MTSNIQIKGEIEAPQKWSENWGPYFKGEVPLEIGDRIKYFESELKKIPATSIHPPKYGVGEPFPEIGENIEHDLRIYHLTWIIGPSHRRKVATFNKT